MWQLGILTLGQLGWQLGKKRRRRIFKGGSWVTRGQLGAAVGFSRSSWAVGLRQLGFHVPLELFGGAAGQYTPCACTKSGVVTFSLEVPSNPLWLSEKNTVARIVFLWPLHQHPAVTYFVY